MLKGKKYDFKDSNLALFGSDIERKVKEAAAETEEAWQGSGEDVGLEIWRIVQFQVVPWPKEQYGEFYMGDSYIVLNTYKEEEEDELKYDLHFWIGKYSTQDEYGTAAYKTVELDTFHHDKPVQHREVQGFESDLFKSYFGTIEYLAGGAETGFRHVTPEVWQPRLLRVRGDRNQVQVTQVPLQRKNVTTDDICILDLGTDIVQWNGAGANIQEKMRAMQFVAELKGKRSHEAVESSVNDEGDDDEFWSKFEGAEPEDEDEDEPDFDAPIETGDKELFRLSDAGGFEKIAEGDEVVRDLLGSEDVFILDVKSACYVWIGGGASETERKQAMGHAHNHLMATDHAVAPISCIKEGRENAEFNALIEAC